MAKADEGSPNSTRSSQGLAWEGEETGNDEGCRIGRDGWESSLRYSSQPRWWGHSQHPRSKDRKGGLGKTRRSLYEKESDEQVVCEEAIV